MSDPIYSQAAVPAPGHEPSCQGTHVAAISCTEITRFRAEREAHDALWNCPNSPSRGQPAHSFGNPESRTVCLNGCGMTWQRLQEASA